MAELKPWLTALGLERYASAFEAAEVDLDTLPHLTEDDLKDIGLALGPRRRILAALAEEATSSSATGPSQSEQHGAPTELAMPERRQVTVMFCDLADSTGLSTRLDAEDYRDTIGAYQRTASAEIERLGGFVAKFMGDGVLAYFGYPSAQEDDAERAVRAGLAVIGAVAGLSNPSGRAELKARVGIATGPVIVGDLIGQGAAREQAIAGETPNLAARLQGLAEDGAVVICAGTRRLTGALFDYRDLGLTKLKGFERPQAAFRVLSANDRLGRFEALRSARTPLVGREEELEILLRRWARAKAGEGQAVLISADAGVGKSRLLAAFRQRIVGDEHLEISAYCSPHAKDSAFYPVSRSLEARAGFLRSDSAEQKLDKLEALAAGAPPEGLALLATLLSLPTDRWPPLNFSPQRLKEEICKAVLAMAFENAQAAPTAIFYEDVHWIDPSSLELMQLGMEATEPGAPILNVFTYRPEFIPPAGWIGRPNVTVINLSRLRRPEAEAMVRRLTGDKTLPPEVVQAILDRADGVPLYLEEITRGVLESGLLRVEDDAYVSDGPLPALAVPASLQASLLARLDKLSPVKEVAQIGAAIGREFSHALLAAVADRSDEDLAEALRQLIEADLIFARGSSSDLSYVFKHALIQDVAYATLLRGPRQALHGKIADALQQAFPDLVKARPELLAHHLSETSRWNEAAKTWRLAVDRAAQAGALSEARAHLDRGFAAARNLPQGEERDRRELELLDPSGFIEQAIEGPFPHIILKSSTPGAELALRLGEMGAFCRWQTGKLMAHLLAGDFRQALQVAGETEQGFGSAGIVELGGVPCSAVVAAIQVPPLLYLGRIAEAYSKLKEAEAAGMDGFVDSVFAADGGMGLGKFDRVRDLYVLVISGRFCAASELTEQILLHPSIARLRYLAPPLLLLDDRQTARRANAQIRRRIQETGANPTFTNLCDLIEASFEIETRGAAGLALADDFVVWTSPFPVDLSFFQILAADAHHRMGDDGRAREYLTDAINGGAPGGQEQWLKAEALRRLGEIDARSDPAEAERRYREALAIAREQGALLWELRAAVALARLLGAPARAELQGVYDRFEEGFDQPDLMTAKALLDDLKAPA
jgi:class 3 adenylate cyclase